MSVSEWCCPPHRLLTAAGESGCTVPLLPSAESRAGRRGSMGLPCLLGRAFGELLPSSPALTLLGPSSAPVEGVTPPQAGHPGLCSPGLSNVLCRDSNVLSRDFTHWSALPPGPPVKDAMGHGGETQAVTPGLSPPGDTCPVLAAPLFPPRGPLQVLSSPGGSPALAGMLLPSPASRRWGPAPPRFPLWCPR